VKENRDALRAKAAAGTPVIYICNPYLDNEILGLTMEGVMKLIERSAGEPMFGDGGFIHNVIANDWDLTHRSPRTRGLETMAHVDTYSPYKQLRPAEWPRGALKYAREKAALAAKGIVIHGANFMTKVDKEIRGLGTVDGIGFEPRRVAKMVEQIVLETHHQDVLNHPTYQTIAAAFGMAPQPRSMRSLKPCWRSNPRR